MLYFYLISTHFWDLCYLGSNQKSLDVVDEMINRIMITPFDMDFQILKIVDGQVVYNFTTEHASYSFSDVKVLYSQGYIVIARTVGNSVHFQIYHGIQLHTFWYNMCMFELYDGVLTLRTQPTELSTHSSYNYVVLSSLLYSSGKG